MAKNKQPPRRSRKRTRPTISETPSPPVKVTVVTSPQRDDGQGSLRGDVRLVKAALLYADKVELLGLTAAMVHQIGLAPGSEALSLTQLMAAAEATGSIAIPPEIRKTLPAIESLRRKGIPLPEDVEAFIAKANALLGPARQGILEMTGATELRPALESGILTVTDLGVGMTNAVSAAAKTGQSSSGQDTLRWMNVIAERLTDRRSRLLFDENSGDFVSAMLSEGIVEPHKIGLRLAGKAAIGAGLVAKLPTFTEPPMDELLDFRQSIGVTLTRYRGAVAKFSNDLPHVIGSELEYEVEHLWESTVAPTIEEINEILHEHAFVKEMARAAMQDISKYLTLTSGLWVGIGAAFDLGQVVAGLASATPGMAEAATRGALAARTAKREAEAGELFYLHQIEQHLAN